MDDGSRDSPEEVVAEFADVELIRQDNAGLSAARNTGLIRARCETILFLDADDLLTPHAIEHNFACMAAHPSAALVYGAFQRVNKEGRPIAPVSFSPTGADPHADLLRGNYIGMHATVLYETETLRQAGGFDETLPKCEDYDVYLRLSRDHSFAHHPALTALYRIHGANMSRDSRAMLKWVERVRARHRCPAAEHKQRAAAWRDGKRLWRRYYAEEMLGLDDASKAGIERGKGFGNAMRTAPRHTGGLVIRRALKGAARRLPQSAKYRAKRLLGRAAVPPVGKVGLGDLDRVRPISLDFGFDRGTPVDRHYIERFLEQNAADIRGRVLEIGDAAYSTRFGTGISQQDVLHVDPEAKGATIIGDLSQPGVLPEGAFDCMIITQTLHLIYDMPTAVERMWSSLKPGGVLLLTVPGISPIDRGEWGDTWFWSLTEHSARRLFAEQFGDGQIAVETNGNAYAATCFVQGLALEEVRVDRLDKTDRSYPVVVTVRAVREG